MFVEDAFVEEVEVLGAELKARFGESNVVHEVVKGGKIWTVSRIRRLWTRRRFVETK